MANAHKVTKTKVVQSENGGRRRGTVGPFLMPCDLHHLIDNALAVWANNQAKTADGALNLARRAISNSGHNSRWPVTYAFTFRFA